MAEPFQQILDAVTAVDANASVYDPDNPNTWTLRESGGTQFYASVADGMGNREAVVQATEANQPSQTTISTGRKVWTGAGDDKFMLADFASAISQPNTIFAAARGDAGLATQVYFDSNSATGGRQQIGRVSEVYRMFAGAAVSGATTVAAQWSTSQANFDGASSEFFLDGVSDATANAGANALGGVGLFGIDATTANWPRPIGPVIIFPSKKTAAELAALRALIESLYPIGEA